MSVKALIRYLAVALLALLAPWAHAQLIEDVTLRRDGGNAVAQVKFVVPVRLQRAIAPDTGDLAQVVYDVIDPIGALNFNLGSGQRRVVGGGVGLPRITITDELIAGASATRRLVVRFDRQVRFSTRTGPGDRTIEIVLVGLGNEVQAPTPLARVVQPPGADKRYLITLLSSRDPNLQMDLPVPAALQEYQVFTERRIVAGQPLYEINLGYFTTLPEAEQARRLLQRRFPSAAVVALADRDRAAVAQAPQAPVPAASAPPVAGTTLPPAPAPEQVQAQATQLLAKAKAAIETKDADIAIQALNQLLDLPNNPLSREAQELVGFVRLRAGDVARARTEFELFLKLYPNGPDADRVRQRLATLPQAEPPPARAQAATPRSTTISGSISQRFFESRSKEQLDDASADDEFVLDQRRADTAVDASLRYRDADRDLRLVFRNNYTKDLLDDENSINRLTAAYLDYRSFSWGTNIRLGRQSPNGGGVVNLFDGVQAGYLFRPKWRVNVVAGVPVFNDALDSKTNFYGLSVDAEALTNSLSGNIYVIQQVTDDQVDRRAFGAELRYFNGGVSASGLIDYDQFIGGINFATLQGSWQLPSTTSFNFLLDYRAQPRSVLALSNALFVQDPTQGPAVQTLEELIGRFGVDELRRRVDLTTGYTKLALLGATTPFSRNWQLGADVRFTNIGDIDPVVDDTVGAFNFPGLTGSGNLYSVSTQLIGTNLYSARDTHVFSVSVVASELINVVALSYSNSSAIGESLLIEPSLRFFYQTNEAGDNASTLSPGLRVTYQLTQRFSLESDLNYEYRKINSSVSGKQTTDSVFYILGGRYDF